MKNLDLNLFACQLTETLRLSMWTSDEILWRWILCNFFRKTKIWVNFSCRWWRLIQIKMNPLIIQLSEKGGGKKERNDGHNFLQLGLTFADRLFQLTNNLVMDSTYCQREPAVLNTDLVWAKGPRGSLKLINSKEMISNYWMRSLHLEQEQI